MRTAKLTTNFLLQGFPVANIGSNEADERAHICTSLDAIRDPLVQCKYSSRSAATPPNHRVRHWTMAAQCAIIVDAVAVQGVRAAMQPSSVVSIGRFISRHYPLLKWIPTNHVFSSGPAPGTKMEDFKVSVESLHTTRIKEITYEGEEIYQEWGT